MGVKIFLLQCAKFIYLLKNKTKFIKERSRVIYCTELTCARMYTSTIE